MKPPDRQRYKLAQYILQQIERRDHTDPDRVRCRIPYFHETFTQLEAAARRLDLCGRKNWRLAAQSQLDAVARLAAELVSRASELQGIAATQSRAGSDPPTQREVLGELLQLEEEFEQVEVDHKNHTVTVHIEPITLEDTYLGPFKVELNLSALSRPGGDATYKIIALDPHPASSNDSVTHPHVRDEELCEGEAAGGIRSALRAGRLCDFFMLVRSVLQTYNPSSPYVALDTWDGIACSDCGHVTGDESRGYCDGCNEDYCDDCMSYCRQCDDSRCRGCLKNCSACDEPTCSSCGNSCEKCRRFVCDGCIEDQLCPDCREKDESDGDPEPITTTEAGGDTEAIPLPFRDTRRQRRPNRHRIAA